MNVNLEYYKIFYHVARLNNITLAAQELFISQPAVSQAIKQLEKSLGGTLFYRTPKGVRLTAEGEVLYKYVSKGYDYLVLAENKFLELLNLESGKISIGASDMTLQFFLLPYLEKFHKLYPKVKIKVTNAPTPETLEYLHRGKIDFGVVSEPVGEKELIYVRPVYKIQDVFVASCRFDQLRNKELSLTELVRYPLICLEGNTSTRSYVDNFFRSNGLALSPEIELATSELIVQFVRKSLGIGCVVKSFADKYIADGELFELKLENTIPERNICIVTQDKLPISPAGKEFLKMLMT